MIWTALILGFAGSLHCLGMCSPLAIAVTSQSPSAILNRTIYNAGRVITYGVGGSLVASFGLIFPLVRYQNLISIIMGISLLFVALGGISAIRIPVVTEMLGNLSVFLKRLFAKNLKVRTYRSTFLLGSLNGILPCGLSFLALTYCLTLNGPVDGFIFMLLFGVGTMPVMLGFTSIFYWAMDRFQFRQQRITTMMLVISGVLLIARVFFVHLPHTGSFQDGVIDVVLCK